MANEKVDVVIVGAGASGSVYASVLAKAGKKVVLLEAGPDWQMSDLISSEIWGRRIRPAGAPFLLEGKNPFGYAGQAGWGVGGAALHYFANHPRFLPNDYKIKSEHNRALDWPISYQDVAPFYDKVAHDIGMSGDAKAEEKWRPAGQSYPMPPMKTFRHGEIWVKGFESLGIRMVPAPVAMNSTEFKGRPACIYDGWCHVGCPTGALANPTVTYLSEARKAKAEVRALCSVTRVLTNAQGTKVAGVEYYDEKKVRQVQEANVVVLAAWAATESAPLAQFGDRQAPKGLNNSNGLVGKYMMTHFISGINAIFDEDIQNHWARSARSTCPTTATARRAIRTRSAAPTSPAVRRKRPRRRFANTRPDLFGPDLARVHEARCPWVYPDQHVRRGVAEHREPDRARERQGRVRHAARPDHSQLSTRTRPRCGMPTLTKGRRSPRPPAPRRSGAGAPQYRRSTCTGGTIMGTDAANSVVNSFGQCHELPNLYIAGPSIFPTEGASNPTYTILAVSLRGAEQLAAKWTTVAG